MNHSKYPGRVNNSIDYYDKGMLIAFGLDVRLRTTENAVYHSLDEAFREFYLTYFGTGSTVPLSYVGYTTQHVINFFDNALPGMGSILENEVNLAGNLTTPDLFQALGFDVHYEDIHALGLFFMNDGEPTIYGVGDNSTAGEVGIAPNDVIISINGFAFTSSGLAWAASQSEPVVLEVLRGHRQLAFTLQPKHFKKIDYLSWNGSDAQASLIKSWLHLDDFSPAAGEKFDLSFYDNFHGIETMY